MGEGYPWGQKGSSSPEPPPTHCPHASFRPTAVPTPLPLSCCSQVLTAQIVPKGGSGYIKALSIHSAWARPD